MKQLFIAIKVTLVTALLLGVAYPLLVTGLARLLFPRQAAGSLIRSNGKVVGSALIGQKFTRPEYFHGRPSGAGTDGYDALASGGPNLGPTNTKLVELVHQHVKQFRDENPTFSGPVPADAVTDSGSGLDPEISPAAAAAQVDRVAAARHLSADAVGKLVALHTEGRQFGVLGEPRVNVLKLNLALDAAQ
jgi:K+-transporting ATPase ATPase C chain